MAQFSHRHPVAGLALLLVAFSTPIVRAEDHWRDSDDDKKIKKVFVVAMENHNWTQPATVAGGIQQIYKNPAAPFINSLVNGTAQVYINGHLENISKYVSYASAYHNVLATPSGNNPHIHPSEPNYLWAEAGTNFGVANDNDPFSTNGATNQTTSAHLSSLLQNAHKTWKSYQEDIDLAKDANGKFINTPLPESQWTVPLQSLSGLFGATSNLNEYNASLQYNYAAKHNPQVFFTDTNGGNDTSTSNLLAKNYAPLQQLAFDLANDNVADYVWITPNQYNDMHSTLTGGIAGLTGDASNIKAGDNFISRIVPQIMSSRAYQEGGVIILWWDESEADGVTGDNGDDFNHTIAEIVISKYAHPNVNGLPYASPVNYTHSSDLRTMQEIFHVGPYLGDAANATDLSDLFVAGVIPKKP